MESGNVDYVQTTEGFNKVEHPIDEWLDLSVPWIVDWKWIIKPNNQFKSVSLVELQKVYGSFPCQPKYTKMSEKTKKLVQTANNRVESFWDDSCYMNDFDSSYNGSMISMNNVQNNTRVNVDNQPEFWRYHHKNSFGSLYERSLESITDHSVSGTEIDVTEETIQDNWSLASISINSDLNSQRDHTDSVGGVEPHAIVQLIEMKINELNDEPAVNCESKCGRKSPWKMTKKLMTRVKRLCCCCVV